jgi:hypothetical protein
LGAGSGLAGGGGGGVAVIGIAGSTFRLLENICIALVSFEMIMGQLFTKVNHFPSCHSERSAAESKNLLLGLSR